MTIATRWPRIGCAAIAILLVSVPLTLLSTLLLNPLWSFIEARYGVESIGHSGPAAWCFWAVYALWVALFATGALLVRRHVMAGAETDPGRRAGS